LQKNLNRKGNHVPLTDLPSLIEKGDAVTAAVDPSFGLP